MHINKGLPVIVVNCVEARRVMFVTDNGSLCGAEAMYRMLSHIQGGRK